jgi:DNA-binding transcriptional regulator YhcF (GntR family)
MVVDFSTLKLNEDSPIYMQIIRHFKMEIIAFNVKNGDELPSRRLLSNLLGVNPNTIQKAYRQLEEEEIVVSYAGSKSIVTLDFQKEEVIREEMILKETTQFIQAIQKMGISLTEASHTLVRLWKEGEK